MKLLEEDEVFVFCAPRTLCLNILNLKIGFLIMIILQDETMHSGADVDAFTAALNRDIEGDSTSPPSDSESSMYLLILILFPFNGLNALILY